MKVKTIKTKKVLPKDDLYKILDRSIKKLSEKSVVVISSKIVGLCENRVVDKTEGLERDDLVKQEAEYYLPRELSTYGFCLSIKNNTMIASAGIDQSNGKDIFILWPENPQYSAEMVWKYLRNKHKVTHLGVIISDSKTQPLRWGVNGTSIGHCGFKALNDYRGKKDIFDNELKVAQTNVAEGLASAAVVVKGEGAEQTPIALITEVPFVQFQKRPPTKQEIANLTIDLKDDLFAPFLNTKLWKKGKKVDSSNYKN